MQPFTFPFCYNDGGRSLSRRPRQTNDCVVRSHAIAFDIPYDQAYDFLAGCGRECGRGVHERLWEANASRFLVRESFQGNVLQFLASHNQGRFIVHVPRHSFAVVNGTLHDMHLDYAHMPVTNAWRVTAMPEKRVVPEFE